MSASVSASASASASAVTAVDLSPYGPVAPDAPPPSGAVPGEPAPAAPAPLAGGTLALLTVGLALGTFMEVLDTSIANVAVPTTRNSERIRTPPTPA